MAKKPACKGTLPVGSQCQNVLLHKNPYTDRASEIVTITGNGMEPMYSDGDRVLIEYCDEIAVGEVGAFELPDIGAVIRYKAADGLRRINPVSDTAPISEDGGIVIGRILCKITPDMIPTPEEEELYLRAVELFGEKDDEQAI